MGNDPRGYWFRSALFCLEPGEEQDANPGRSGRQMANWLAGRLRDRGCDVEAVIPEDWGWCVVCRRGPDRLLAACGNVDVEPGAPEVPPPANPMWHCFPVVASPMWRRLLRRREVALALKRFDGELREILEAEPAIALTHKP